MFAPHIARQQKCDIQQFYSDSVWNKPPGVSHVYMLLIGGGGNGGGAGGNGGGSGAVTVWYGAAQNVPNSLNVSPSTVDFSSTTISTRNLSGALTILSCSTGAGTGGGGTTAANYFANSGFYTSTAGQPGASGSITSSSTTFLSGGSGSGNPTNANYRYGTTNSGYFQLQPIIVGVGGSSSGVGGIGCGGGHLGVGGRGFVLIASW